MRLLVVTPVDSATIDSGRVTIGYSNALRTLSITMPTESMDTVLMFGVDVVRARNRAASIALGMPGWDYVLWWDEDNYPRDVMALVRGMIATGEDMIAAPYTTKGDKLGWVHTLLPENPSMDSRGVLPVRSCGFGFTMTSRRCLEWMWVHCRKYRDARRDGTWPIVADMFGQVFERIVPNASDRSEDMTLMSEDFSFCSRWRSMGGTVAMYGGPNNLVEHVGAVSFDATMIPGAVR